MVAVVLSYETMFVVFVVRSRLFVVQNYASLIVALDYCLVVDLTVDDSLIVLGAYFGMYAALDVVHLIAVVLDVVHLIDAALDVVHSIIVVLNDSLSFVVPGVDYAQTVGDEALALVVLGVGYSLFVQGVVYS